MSWMRRSPASRSSATPRAGGVSWPPCRTNRNPHYHPGATGYRFPGIGDAGDGDLLAATLFSEAAGTQIDDRPPVSPFSMAPPPSFRVGDDTDTTRKRGRY